MSKTQTKKTRDKVDRRSTRKNGKASQEESATALSQALIKQSAASKKRVISITYKPDDEIVIEISGGDDNQHDPDPERSTGDDNQHDPDPE